MTLIVASREGWMAADRRVSFGHSLGPFDVRKITNIGYALIGNAGQAGFAQHGLEMLKASTPETLLPNIAQFLLERGGENGISLMVLTAWNELGLFDTSGAWHPIKKSAPYFALGGGEDFAMGYLRAHMDYDKHISLPVVKKCIKACEKQTSGVGDGIQVEYLNG